MICNVSMFLQAMSGLPAIAQRFQLLVNPYPCNIRKVGEFEEHNAC